MYRIRIFDMRKIIVLFLPMMFLLSCGIDVPELNVSLRPPMGLSVKYITNSVRIEFWGSMTKIIFQVMWFLYLIGIMKL